MIFPAHLPKVTFYLPIEDVYHEINVASASTRFDLERYFDREAISGRRQASVRGFRFECDFQFEQTTQHATFVDLYDDMYTEIVVNGGQYIDLYLTNETQASTATVSPVRIVANEVLIRNTFSNTIGRFGYNLSFSGHLVEADLELGEIAFVIDNNGDFVITSGGDFVIIEATIG